MIEIVHKGGEPEKPSQTFMMIQSSEGKLVKKPIVERSVNKLSSTNGEPSAVVKKGSLSDIAAKQGKSKVVVPGVTNKPVVIVEGARTDPVIIKTVTQLLIINSKAIPWKYKRVTVTYKGNEVKEEVNEAYGLTCLGRCFSPEELRKAKTSKDNPVLVKKAVTEEEEEEFLRKIKVQDYSIVEQLRKTPAQISLLIHSDEHRRALMRILNEAHILDQIPVNHLEKIANKIFEANRVTFSDDELPAEGTEHNRALYLTVKFEESVVTRVLVDNGSSAKICPLSTLNKFKVDDERIHKNRICVRRFDGGGKDSVGDIVDLGFRPPEQSRPLCNRWSSSSGIDRKSLCMARMGIIQPVSLPRNLGTFGLGFKPTSVDVKRSIKLKQRVWTLPKPIPHLSRSFVKPGAKKRPVKIVPSSVVDVDEELIERFQSSFYADFNDMTCMRNLQPSFETQSNSKIIIQEKECDDESEYDEDEVFEEINFFAWSYDDMPGLSTDLVVHKLPTDPTFPHVKQTLRKFKTNMSVKIKEEGTKQFDAKDGKCVDYRDLNKSSPKDNFPVPNIYILIDNCAKHEIGSFVDCYVGYHQILMDEKDTEKMKFIMPWGTYCYRVMPFGLKNAGAMYMRAMKTIFHDMIHKEIKVYVDIVILKSRKQFDHIIDLRKFFQRLRKYNLKLNPAKCAFCVPSRKLLGFITDMKAQILADHLAEKPVDEEYEPLRTYFPDEEVMHIDELEQIEKTRFTGSSFRGQFKCWKLGAHLENRGKAARFKGVHQPGAHLKNKGKQFKFQGSSQVLVIRSPPGEQREAIQVLVIRSPPEERREKQFKCWSPPERTKGKQQCTKKDDSSSAIRRPPGEKGKKHLRLQFKPAIKEFHLEGTSQQSNRNCKVKFEDIDRILVMHRS
ncbi:uncharacterized protein [Nicotiana sylvestris]|uniref:uncharacterized protein n=1 Tax=Nicotiana sylvestris TaxID=4096 RepID=UPI00388C6DF5